MGRKLELSFDHILKISNRCSEEFPVEGKCSLVAVCTVALKRKAEQMERII